MALHFWHNPTDRSTPLPGSLACSTMYSAPPVAACAQQLCMWSPPISLGWHHPSVWAGTTHQSGMAPPISLGWHHPSVWYGTTHQSGLAPPWLHQLHARHWVCIRLGQKAPPPPGPSHAAKGNRSQLGRLQHSAVSGPLCGATATGNCSK